MGHHPPYSTAPLTPHTRCGGGGFMGHHPPSPTAPLTSCTRAVSRLAGFARNTLSHNPLNSSHTAGGCALYNMSRARSPGKGSRVPLAAARHGGARRSSPPRVGGTRRSSPSLCARRSSPPTRRQRFPYTACRVEIASLGAPTGVPRSKENAHPPRTTLVP